MKKPSKVEIKQKIVEESRELLFLTGYLALFLTSLSIYHSLILNQTIFSFFHFGYNLLEALLLAKIILLGKMLHLGEKFEDKPLIIPSLYTAGVFTIFVFVFSTIEHFFVGYLEKKPFDTIMNELLDHGFNQILGKMLITFLVFILLFSFRQVSRIIGEEKLFRLFFRKSNE